MCVCFIFLFLYFFFLAKTVPAKAVIKIRHRKQPPKPTQYFFAFFKMSTTTRNVRNQLGIEQRLLGPPSKEYKINNGRH